MADQPHYSTLLSKDPVEAEELQDADHTYLLKAGGASKRDRRLSLGVLKAWIKTWIKSFFEPYSIRKIYQPSLPFVNYSVNEFSLDLRPYSEPVIHIIYPLFSGEDTYLKICVSEDWAGTILLDCTRLFDKNKYLHLYRVNSQGIIVMNDTTNPYPLTPGAVLEVFCRKAILGTRLSCIVSILVLNENIPDKEIALSKLKDKSNLIYRYRDNFANISPENPVYYIDLTDVPDNFYDFPIMQISLYLTVHGVDYDPVIMIKPPTKKNDTYMSVKLLIDLSLNYSLSRDLEIVIYESNSAKIPKFKHTWIVYNAEICIRTDMFGTIVESAFLKNPTHPGFDATGFPEKGAIFNCGVIDGENMTLDYSMGAILETRTMPWWTDNWKLKKYSIFDSEGNETIKYLYFVKTSDAWSNVPTGHTFMVLGGDITLTTMQLPTVKSF